MADEVSNLSGKLGIDTTDFKTQISAANREIRLLESSFRAGAAGLQNWTKDATGLESRIRTLNSQIELQKQKVTALAAEHARVATEEGANSKAAQELQIRVNQATGVLNKMQLELGQDRTALEDVRKGGESAGQGMNEAAKKSVTLKDALSSVKSMADGVKTSLSGVAKVIQGELAVAFGVLKVGVGAMLGLGAAVLGAGVLLTGLELKAAGAADQLGELSEKTHISTQRLQELAFVGTIIGTDLETVTGANARMIRSMAGAEKGTGAQADAFKELGVRVTDSSGKLRDSNAVFGEVLDKLRNIQDPTERDALAMAIFGKSAQELNPLINAGSKGIQELADRAHRLGAVVDNETINALGNLRDQFDGIKLGLQGVGTTILGAFAPFFSGVLGTAQGYLERLVRVVRSSGGDFNLLAQGISSLFSSVVKDLASSAPQMFQNGLVIVQSLVQALTGALPSMLSAARSIVVTLAAFIIQNLPALADTAQQILSSLADTLIQILPLLFTVGLQILQTLFTGIIKVLPALLPQMAQTGLKIIGQLLLGIQQAFPALLELAPQILQTLIGFLQENLRELIAIGIPLISQLVMAVLQALPMLVDAALQILIALANALTAQLPTLVPVMVQVMLQIIQTLVDNLPLLITAALALIQALTEGLIAALPILIAAAPQIITSLVTAITGAMPQIVNVAVQLIVTLALGLVQNLPLLVQAAVQLVVGLSQALIKQGPMMANVGKALIDGLKKGWDEHWQSFVDNIVAGFNDMIDFIKTLLGIASPSRVFGEIGKNSALGFNNAFLGGLEELRRQTASAMQGLLGTSNLGLAAGASVSNNNQNFDFFAPVIIQGETPAGSLGASLKARRF